MTAVAVGLKPAGGDSRAQRVALVVFVKKKRLRGDQTIPPVIDGVPTDVRERSFAFRPMATDPHQRFDTLFSGIAVTCLEDPTVNGSIGCFVRTTGKVAGGGHPVIPAGVYLLTNHHVLQVAGAPGGDTRIIQPEFPAYDQFGNPVPANYVCGNYVDGYRNATNDCAIASLAGGRSWSNSVPAAPWWPGSRWFGGVSAAALNSNVYKFGATTRYTTGTITAINFNTPGNAVMGAIYVENAAHDTWAAGGDSGSVCAYPYTNNVVGLNFQEDAACPANGGVGMYAGLAYPIQTQLDNFCDAGGTASLPWL